MSDDTYNAETDIPQYNRDLNACIVNRQRAYTSALGGWTDQLDMIYTDFEGWRTKITEIKTRFPKPTLPSDGD
jgi:hypothetical protein